MTDSWCWVNCSTCQTQGSDIQLSLPTAHAARTQQWFEVSINNFLSSISTHLLPFIFHHQAGYKGSPQFSPSLFMFSPLPPSFSLLGVQISRQIRSICDSCPVCREPCEILWLCPAAMDLIKATKPTRSLLQCHHRLSTSGPLPGPWPFPGRAGTRLSE